MKRTPDLDRVRRLDLGTLDRTWDLIVVGGGITGAGVFREAARMGLKVLLLEARDFSWGTSSRSAKLVHGGLRYLKEGKFRLTRQSVRARERLLREAPGLVEPLHFLAPMYENSSPSRWVFEVGLSVYDFMAHKRQHKFCAAREFEPMVPFLRKKGLKGGFRFLDAQVDDCRLVLRLIGDGMKDGGSALNYVSVEEIQRTARGDVRGVTARDSESGAVTSFSSRAVVNATGPWAERLHPSPESNRHLRPLRGSHLIFPAAVLPVRDAVSFFHPQDRRPLYVIPWEGAVIFGTTDVDHKEDLDLEPTPTREEVGYLMEGLRGFFPDANASLKDCLSCFSGIRPVLSEGNLPPSKESREHVVWVSRGLITVTGGKLTTFQNLAFEALKAARPFLRPPDSDHSGEPIFAGAEMPHQHPILAPAAMKRLYGRYGGGATDLISISDSGDLDIVPGTHTLWAELPFVAAREQVRHLDDLLLRRVRIGLLCAQGGREYLSRVQELCRSVLPWDDARWDREIAAYLAEWQCGYAPLEKDDRSKQNRK